MGSEIDFLPVGDEGQSGDAILLRSGNLSGPRTEQTVVLIDGGFRDTADDIVEHLAVHYETAEIDLVVSTHPDCDHINGLRAIIERAVDGELLVRELWIHRPSVRRERIERAVAKAAGTGYLEAVKNTLDTAAELEQEATAAGIPIREPFTGLTHSSGQLVVIGPTEPFYSALFEEEAHAAAEESRLMRWLGAAREVVHRVFEDWDVETLGDDGVTSPVNNSSAIIFLAADNHRAMFTADAGIPALTRAAGFLESAGLSPEDLDFIQVPHHGSRRNVGPTVLDRLLGPRRPRGDPVRTAFVSCAKKGAPKHPAKKVTNAFIRRGTSVHATQGAGKCHFNDSPGRAGWIASTPLPLYNKVEE